jgi:thiamine pyrophosphate-dependent acetolactate synthase large subunit-like protein
LVFDPRCIARQLVDGRRGLFQPSRNNQETEMASDYTVGDLVAEFLSQCGVTTAFGIASVHNIPMLDAIGRRNAIRFMMARGELGGAHMADGYARVSGGLGVIFSSTGPGAANAIGGLIPRAHTESVPHSMRSAY